MLRFNADTLNQLRAAREVSIRTEKHPDGGVVIWVVVADDEVFVRSWRGTGGRWYRDLVAGGGERGAWRPPPDDRCHGNRSRQRRILAEAPTEHACARDGADRNPADNAAARATRGHEWQ